MNFTYTFNICGNVNKVPADCVGQPCVPTRGGAGALHKTGVRLTCPPPPPLLPLCRASPAYQYINGTGTCAYLGTDVSLAPFTPQSSLLDTTQPASGFSMTYISGRSCPNGNGAARTMTISFTCAPFPLPPAGSFLPWGYYVEETNTCEYNAIFFSTQGCPQECPVGANGGLCSNNGICGYDKNLNSGTGGARCFCDDDFLDADCSNPRSPLPTGAIAGAAIGGILSGMVALFGFSYYKTTRGLPTVEGFYGGSVQ